MAEPAVFAELGPSLFVLMDFRPSQECGQRFDVISLWCGLSPLSFPCRNSLQTHTCVWGCSEPWCKHFLLSANTRCDAVVTHLSPSTSRPSSAGAACPAPSPHQPRIPKPLAWSTLLSLLLALGRCGKRFAPVPTQGSLRLRLLRDGWSSDTSDLLSIASPSPSVPASTLPPKLLIPTWC